MKCELCPNRCGADRRVSPGKCGTGETARVARYSLHPYEEPPVSGSRGSGAVFFSGCALRCAFCQNAEISHRPAGAEVTPKRLAELFRELEGEGAHNINLVNPTHFYPAIMRALDRYRPSVPIVVNTHGYERVETLRAFAPYADVWLPDLKFLSPELSLRYTGVRDYFERASEAILFMAETPLAFADGLIKSGTIVRHLVLPLASGEGVRAAEWFARNLRGRAKLSLLAQYTPHGDLSRFPELRRTITRREYDRVVGAAAALGILDDCFLQELSSAGEEFIPEWDYRR